ncbi:MAG TPA: hypothetical protein VHJ57_03850 [Nitrososphaeraceae archaeon]|jgi:hypothetical protein|nr:hypothetical protein [Nitrososphaeraceae archaeon]
MYRLGDNDELKVDVFINNSSGGEVASKLTGYFVVKNKSFRFSAIAFGRIGGHNISIKLSTSSINKLTKMEIDPEKLQLTIQRKLIEGDVNLPQNMKLPK